MSNVSGIIKSIQDIMRKDVGVDGDAQRISQLVWMFFLKIFDDRESELELLEDNYKSPLPEHLRWRAWAKDSEGITGDALSDFVNIQLFPTLKGKLVTHGSAGERARVVRSVFEDAYNYMKSGTLMRQVINKISEIDFNNTGDRHTFGNIYEQILRDLQSAGNAGEFYTPRAVTRFIVNRVDPKLDESVLDPACGTGGFLTCTIDHKREHYLKTKEDEETLIASINGVEKKSMPHMLAVTNMILHGIDTPTNIRHDNTLSRPYKDYGNKDRVNVIITNPPFGGMEEDGIENNFPATFRTRETADLFVALIIKLLKNQGRAAVVLPDGFLFGEGMKTRLKESLLSECNLHTIVRLPNGVFAPYTGIKTNLLFFTKGKPTEHVWYYEHPYPVGVKSYNKTKPMRFEEFEIEINWWGNEADGFLARVPTEQAWKVPVADIVARKYNMDIKNPHIGGQISHDPDELLQLYKQQQRDIMNLTNQLSGLLQQALSGVRNRKSVEIIINSLDVWTAAHLAKKNAGRVSSGKQDDYGIEKLRNLILGLAIRGKLVSQESGDVPACELMKKIALEKYQLIKKGKIKKEKKFPRIADDEVPFELPDGWEWARINDVGHDWGQKAPDSNFTYIDVSAIDNNSGVVSSPNVMSSSDAPSRARKIVRKGTVMYSTVRPYLKNICVIEEDYLPEPIASTAFAILHPFQGMPGKYFALYFRSPEFVKYVESIQTGIAYPAINDKQFYGGIVPVPPLAVQHRIVAKVDELMALCDVLNARLADAQTTQIHLADTIVEQAVA